MKSDLSKKPLKEEFDDPSLPVCWKGPKAFKSVKDVKKYFKTLALNFVNGQRALLEVPPENYLIITVSTCNLSLTQQKSQEHQSNYSIAETWECMLGNPQWHRSWTQQRPQHNWR